MILRAGEVAGPGVVICKTSKPRQDSRFDVPVIGLQTVRTMIEAKASCLAVEAGATLFFNQAEAIELAQRHGICLYASSAASGADHLSLAGRDDL
ncbi:MAG: hypothetical protein BWZ10_00106 [candidate division BRC1 bacterium ADurb.BinA364]|nr:MAG: hypothetical protein BWZ10_00106 [candidate division BRC1 bacterium ADurb.BinA364]